MYVTMFTYGCMNVEKSLEAHTLNLALFLWWKGDRD